MNLPSRRNFVKAMATVPAMTVAKSLSAESLLPEDSGLVKLSGDGLSLSTSEHISVLQQILTKRGIAADNYSRGGVVEELEEKMAKQLGKERAIYFPTGTLANHIAIRELARGRTRVIVPNDSHIYNDSGDSAQQLSQLNLIPLSSDNATFSLDQVKQVVQTTKSGRVETGVGVIAIESPVRRRTGEMFDFSEMKRICSFARENGIKTHLDGARLYIASGYSGISPAEYASHFDSVYVSLWKYFNSISGAILAGEKDLIESLFHTRRMFGAGLPGAWPFASLALHYCESFTSDFASAVSISKEFFSRLKEHPSFGVTNVSRGTNLVKLAVRSDDLENFRKKLRERGVLVSRPRSEWGGFLVSVNPTLNRTKAETLASQFIEAL